MTHQENSQLLDNTQPPSCIKTSTRLTMILSFLLTGAFQILYGAFLVIEGKKIRNDCAERLSQDTPCSSDDYEQSVNAHKIGVTLILTGILTLLLTYPLGCLFSNLILEYFVKPIINCFDSTPELPEHVASSRLPSFSYDAPR